VNNPDSKNDQAVKNKAVKNKAGIEENCVREKTAGTEKDVNKVNSSAKNKNKKALVGAGVLVYLLFILISCLIDFQPGQEMGLNLWGFTLDMLKILPCTFILIGLFEVWVKQETVEKHMGERAGILGYVWAIFLAGTSVGGVIVAFPVAYTLFKKGAKLSVLLTYVGASGVCRIPMTIFEASFLGLKFTIIRYLVALPLVIISSIFLGNFLEKHNYQMSEGR
jgi:hypothetical protein